MRLSLRVLFSVLLVSLTAVLGSLAQQRGAVGSLDANLYAAVPAGSAIWVRPATGSALHREIAKRVAADLSARGYHIVQGHGHYELLVRAASSVEFDPQEEPWVHLEDNSVMVRSKLGGPSRVDHPIRPRILLAEMHDADGNLAWSAQATLTGGNAGQDKLLALLLPSLLAEMFNSAYDKVVPAATR